jgi:hypothetical protein
MQRGGDGAVIGAAAAGGVLMLLLALPVARDALACGLPTDGLPTEGQAAGPR